MKIYIAIWEDRYGDTIARPFSTPEKAVAWARKTAKEYCSYPDDYEEKQISNWIFYARYSCEGDCVSVREETLDRGP